MRCKVPDPASEYHLEAIEVYTSRHGFPVIALSLKEREDPTKTGTITLAYYDLLRIQDAMGKFLITHFPNTN
jgi:hypothetical protein